MLKIIRERSTHTEVDYYIEFTDEECAGFSFTCDSKGNIQFNDDIPELGRRRTANFAFPRMNVL